ncbi:MAG: HU family DNA-binding protein, partial [Prevotellaceae bacterium]|nr:HU family DNA-binding protein [Prevotellaceae bacterium]
MNNEKLNMQDLIAGIADKTGETKKDADLFLREFVSLIQEALLQDKTLKITGLGTFKLQWNESRKSVNVQTGEEIEIAGHHKIVFSPETELKDAVNEPFAHLETIIIGDSEESKEELPNPLTGLSVQAQEIASMIAEIKAMPTEVEPEKTEEHTNSNHIMEQIIPTQQPQETSTAVFPEVSKPIEEETAFDTSQVDTPETEEITEENPPKKKKKRVWLWILLVLLVLLIA